jgi:retinol dehydrogenase-12
LDLLQFLIKNFLLYLTDGTMYWDDIMLEKNYSANKAYRQSKIANILFTKELKKRLEGTNVTVVSLHPGVVRTELSRYEKEGLGWLAPIIRSSIYPLWWVLTKSPKQGSQTSIHCAVDSSIINGAYYRFLTYF